MARRPRKLPEGQLANARLMRRERATEVEKLLWRRLRDAQLGWKFRRQHPIGPYILDFYCHEGRLVVELDGGQHAKGREAGRDRRRDRYLAEQGLRVLRFWNNEVLENMDGVVMAIVAALEDGRED